MASTCDPSNYLPALLPLPPHACIATVLDQLDALLHPEDIVIDLISEKASWNGPEGMSDEYEIQFTRSWLQRLLTASMSLDEPRWDSVMELASRLLSTLSGHCSAGPSTKIYNLPLPTISPPDTSSKVSTSPAIMSIIVRDSTLVESSTGFRTWGSAPLLARRIASDHSSIFPHAPSRLRVLELGSGTGLVGLTAAATLNALDREAIVTLSDYDDAIWRNLSDNLGRNRSLIADKDVDTNAMMLDWSDIPRDMTRYDVILGADLCFEPTHPLLLYEAILNLLALPTEDKPEPTFHLVIPFRATHLVEHQELDRLFSTADSLQPPWTLAIKSKEEVSAVDGFGSRKEAREVPYLIYRIGWANYIE